MIVTPSAHEKALSSLARQLEDLGLSEDAGIHGPESRIWQMNARLSNFLGAGRAILLQLAHPYVAYAIAEHSTTVSDVRGRFQATFENVFGMTFGTRAEAFASARTVHRVHSRIHGKLPEQVGRFSAGHRYHGNDAAALLWVHSTLIGTSMHMQQLMGGAAAESSRSEVYESSKRFALLFGLDSSLVPANVAEFEAYVEKEFAGETLCVSPPALEMANFLLKAPTPALRPLFAMYRALTAKLLPERIRKAYGMRLGAKEEAMASMLLGASKTVLPRLPPALRNVPAAMTAETRLGLRPESVLSHWLERSMQAGLGLWS